MAGYTSAQLDHMATQFLGVEARELGAAIDPDESHPIGTLEQVREIMATRIGEKNGQIVFLDEIGIRVDPAREYELAAGGMSSTFRRFEVKARREVAQSQEDHAVVAKFPDSIDWLDHGPFKPGLHRSIAEGERVKLEVLRSDAPQKHLAELAVDLFEKNPKWLTAALTDPRRIAPNATTGQRERALGLWAFGVCREPEAVASRLLESPAAQELKALTAEGRLFEVRHLGVARVRMHEVEPKVRKLADEVLTLAAWKALAGPSKEVDKWLGKPATELMDQIYVRVLYAANQRARGTDPVPVPDPTAEDEPGDEPTLAAQIELYASKFAQLAAGDFATIQRVVESQLKHDLASMRSTACQCLAALRHLTDPETLPLDALNAMASNPMETPEVRAAARLAVRLIDEAR